jgi:hypothetical protein
LDALAERRGKLDCDRHVLLPGVVLGRRHRPDGFVFSVSPLGLLGSLAADLGLESLPARSVQLEVHLLPLRLGGALFVPLLVFQRFTFAWV